MASPLRLSSEERTFFGAVADFVFGNPFAESRAQLLAGLIPGLSARELMRDRLALRDVLAPRLARFDSGGLARLEDFAAEDRARMEAAYLYLCYHRFVEDLDRLIRHQLNSAVPVSVPFASAVFAELGARGIDTEACGRYLSFFYQLRRAFYFLEASLSGGSPSMRSLRESLWNVVFTHDMRNFSRRLWDRMEDFSTLLFGETGTGKGNAAAAIGRSSFIPFSQARGAFVASFTETFVAVNLSQFAENLIESELFGHRKGAFTGAIEHHQGALERCSAHGSLFLDEIGEVSVPVQIKLLQVLQERTFTPVGGREQKRFSGRVIAATNRSLEALRRDGRFRDDFFYRLCSDVIVLPPLRQRIEESPGELERLVRQLVARTAGGEGEELATLVLGALARDLPRGYAWPGNVRELEQAVRRILLTGRYTADGFATAADAEEALVSGLRAGTLGAEELLGGYCALHYRRLGSYAEVAERTGLDRRTVRKYVKAHAPVAPK